MTTETLHRISVITKALARAKDELRNNTNFVGREMFLQNLIRHHTEELSRLNKGVSA